MDEHLSLMLSAQLAPPHPPALILLAENFGGGEEGEISGSFPLLNWGDGGLLW